jgi:hypothetical protein
MARNPPARVTTRPALGPGPFVPFSLVPVTAGFDGQLTQRADHEPEGS